MTALFVIIFFIYIFFHNNGIKVKNGGKDMKINYISSFISKEIETPDDENGFYRLLAKKMASEQPPCTVKIQTPYGNASYSISNRSGTILIQESSNNIVFPDSAQCSEYPTAYLTCVNGEKITINSISWKNRESA